MDDGGKVDCGSTRSIATLEVLEDETWPEFAQSRLEYRNQ